MPTVLAVRAIVSLSRRLSELCLATSKVNKAAMDVISAAGGVVLGAVETFIYRSFLREGLAPEELQAGYNLSRRSYMQGNTDTPALFPAAEGDRQQRARSRPDSGRNPVQTLTEPVKGTERVCGSEAQCAVWFAAQVWKNTIR
jgi:hypothetical protein